MSAASRRLRVALVSEHASPLAPIGHPETGGQNVYVEALARRLGARGCDVDVYTRRSDRESPDDVALGPGVVVRHVAAGPPAPIARDELAPHVGQLADGLEAAWRRRPPDVVHAHFWMSGWAALRAAAGTLPVVQTFHALGSVKRRHQGDADTSPPERVEVERRLVAAADLVIATCRDEVAELRELGAHTGRTVVIPCGVGDEFSPFGPLDPTPRTRPHRLLCVSRLVPRKGIADVVRALPLLGGDVELVVVGGDDPGVDRDAAALRRLADELDVADRVVLRGRLDAPAVAAAMRAADVVVCAPWYEPFGIVPVEAMACGVPVVGTAVGGLLDTVVDGLTGSLVPPRRPDGIAAAVRSLLDDGDRRRRVGRAAARRSVTYRWPTVAEAVLDAYLGVISRRGAGAERAEALA